MTAEQTVADYDDAALTAACDEALASFEHTVRTNWPKAVEAYRAWRAAVERHNAERSAFNDAFQTAYGRTSPFGTYGAHVGLPGFSELVDRALSPAFTEEDHDHG